MKRLRRLSGFFILVFLLLSCAGGESAPPELEQASDFIAWMLAPVNLSRSTYPVVLPDGTPKQFVSWLFSTMGVAEWPPDEAMAKQHPDEAEMARAIGSPLLPTGVRFVHTRPDSSAGKQLVLKWDDARNVVIAEGYLDPSQPPVLTKEWTLPKVQSTNEMARMVAQSHLEMGGSYQAF